jgi:thiamine-monophosphate kinase
LTTPGSARPLPAPSGSVADVGEHGLIEHIRRRLPPAPPSVVIGIGDDAAVAAADRGTLQVLTTDALVEGVHFDRRFSTPADIGYKALAVNVSDIAAMGATPRLALLSLILPASLPFPEVDGLLDGLLQVAHADKVTLVGGNITRSPGPLVVDVTLIGSVRPRRFLTRSGGQPGDQLYVTGTIGAAAAGLGWLREHATLGTEIPEDSGLAECVLRHRRPEPRARIGGLLGRSRAATACMDLSDGLADAVRQLAAASGAGARISAEALPIHAAARRWFSRDGGDPLTAAAAGGDDYELLFAVSKRARGRLRHVIQQARGIPVTRIGELTVESAIRIERDGAIEPLPDGFVHF